MLSGSSAIRTRDSPGRAEIYLDRFPIWKNFFSFFLFLGSVIVVAFRVKEQKQKEEEKNFLSDENSRASHRLILDSLSCMLFFVKKKSPNRQTIFFLFFSFFSFPLTVVGGGADGIEYRFGCGGNSPSSAGGFKFSY
jgi:hypothetical protein